MPGTSYYYLVSSLPELVFQQAKLPFNIKDFKENLKSEVTPNDYGLVELLFLPYDNKNLINLLDKNDKPFDDRGIFSKEVLEYELNTKEPGPSQEFPNTPLEYIHSFIVHYYNEMPLNPNLSVEDQLTEYFYQFILLKVENEFVHRWFDFEKNLKNFITGQNAKRHEFYLEEKIIGNDDVAHTIKTSKSKDFGLSQDLDYLIPVLNAYDNQNLLEREKQIDLVRWNYLNGLTTFHYFTIEKVLAYIIKLNIIERWINLDAEKGKKAFESIVNELQNSYEFPKEFIING